MPRSTARNHGNSVSYRPWLNMPGDFMLADSESIPIQFSHAFKATTALTIGDFIPLPPVPPPPLLITVDEQPGDITTTATLTVDAPHTISTIDGLGDQDFFKVTLEAGQDYEIGMYGYSAGPNAVPLLDAYIEVYDSAGNLIVSADGGAPTPANDINSGFDVLLTYTPDVSGTYYINARAFDQDPSNNDAVGGPGDGAGDYELFVREALPGAYQPYYSVDSPLYAIDWGSQVDGTARNPDGNEGPRDTGNDQGTPDPSPFAIAGKNVVTIYFARPGDVFISNDPANPGLPPAIVAVGAQDFEKASVWTALHEFEKVADVVYVEVQDRSQANFFYVTYSGTPGPGISLLGSMSPPGESDEGLAQFNSGDYRWNESDLQQGGFSFTTLIHEFGHGNGLAHPHDNGGQSGIMHGVDGVISTPAGDVPDPTGVYPAYTLGDYHLNQAVFTMMSYQDGWQDSPYGNADTDVGYGYLGSLMAFDIAAIQDKYGVNEETATGNDTYVLKDVNAPGTYYSSIWDAAGTDGIVYLGARDATIDLRPATLRYEEGGGGRVSFAYGIYGGFTIANGVTIENATGGSGNDTINGNSVDNILNGGAGMDQLTGFAGNDLYFVDNAGDIVAELAGEGNDIVATSVSYALAAGTSIELLTTGF
ncbi:MAG TPA: M10 family metallopeptidase C-terminal domain-containing protein, partial [Allosphingosinicella sp.]